MKYQINQFEGSRRSGTTPWHNDAVGDPSGEALCLRDEDDGHVWISIGHGGVRLDREEASG